VDFVSYENIVLKLMEMSLEAIIQIVLSYFNVLSVGGIGERREL
jgi:hypothetical protein